MVCDTNAEVDSYCSITEQFTGTTNFKLLTIICLESGISLACKMVKFIL